MLKSTAGRDDSQLDIVEQNLPFGISNTFDFSWELSQTREAFSFTQTFQRTPAAPPGPL